MPSRTVRAVGPFCPHCHAPIKKMTGAEKLMIQTILDLTEEHFDMLERMDRIFPAFAPNCKVDVITKTSGLHESTVVNLLIKLTSLGYLEARKAYLKKHNVYRVVRGVEKCLSV